MNKLLILLNNPKIAWKNFYYTYFSRLIPDRLYLKLEFKKRVGYTLNLQDPQSYNEKLQWLKLYDLNPHYSKIVDKYEVRNFVKEKIGKEYLIPLIGIWDNFDEINLNQLPHKFVLKCTHDSGGVLICKDKKTFDVEQARKFFKKRLKKNFFYSGREWPYKNIKPRIIAEQYMEDSVTHELRDYKYFVFDGKVKALFIATDRQNPNEEVKFDFFDSDFNYLPIKQGHENAKERPIMPAYFDEMKILAAKLAEGMTEVRVDFYEVNNKVYFGELTLFHHGGWTAFEPQEWDYQFGKWIDLESVNFPV